MQDLLAKMVLCAPTTWFDVVTGNTCISELESYDMDGSCFLFGCLEPYRDTLSDVQGCCWVEFLICLPLSGGALRKSCC